VSPGFPPTEISEQPPFLAGQERVDRLFDRAKMHTSAGVHVARFGLAETILLSIRLGQGKIIAEIPDSIEDRS